MRDGEPPAAAAPGARQPVRVVRVPPPAVSPLPLRALAWGFLLVFNLAVNPPPLGRGWANRLVQAAVPALLVAGCVIEGRRRRTFNRRRRRWLETHANWSEDPVAREIGRRWWMLDRAPGLPVIRRALGAAAARSATVVSLGAFKLSGPGDFRFEPVIVSHGRLSTPGQLAVVVRSSLR